MNNINSLINNHLLSHLFQAIVWAILIVFFSNSLQASNSPLDKHPIKVRMGIYPLAIYDLNPAKGTFKLSFYEWWKTPNKHYDPTKTVEISNATDYEVKSQSRVEFPNELKIGYHYYATLMHDFNVRFFPFDRQRL